jgi:hypothetical protein
MTPKKSTSVILVVALGISLLANVALFLRLAILKSEYSWLRDTYETDIVGAYQNDGRLTAHLEHFDGRSREYLLDSTTPSMGLPVENFYSHKPMNKGNTNLLRRVLRVFDTSPKPEPERIWHTKLKNRWLEEYVKEHNATLTRLRSEKP